MAEKKYSLTVVIILMIITALFCVGIWAIFNAPQPNTQKQLKKQLDTLEINFKSLQAENERLEKKTTRLYESIVSLQARDRSLADSMKYYETKLITVKKQYEKLNRFDHYSSDSLRVYFSNEFR